MDPSGSVLNDDDIDESLWDSPAKPTHDQWQSPKGTAKHPTTAKPTYQEQQAREDSLRQELESVRRVNETIEGVIQSLAKAKDNMKVNALFLILSCSADLPTDCQQHCDRCFEPSQHMDTNLVTNRTQPTSNPRSQLVRREPRYCGPGRRGR